MPPKADGVGKSVVSNDAFLATCIKHAKERLVVNFETLSQELKMSSGGASNKFRAIMKQFESEGATWAAKDANGDPVTPVKAKAAAGTKRKPAPKKESKDDTAAADSAAEDEPAKKKPKRRAAVGGAKKVAKKSAPKAISKAKVEEISDEDEAVKKENSGDDDDDDEGDHDAEDNEA